ncbi:MAG: malto-oligosyltrehalose synthase [Chloroflexi bacterium]|nr:malto-oligosyltrehalose synthase [Chloroflexota bacterium]
MIELTDVVAALAGDILNRRRIPCSTYRLQFNRAFTFRDALALVPYLHDLGITDCYASPLLKPSTDSDHGYDICDHSQLNPALGSEEDFEAFVAALRARDMGLILDAVPNHMGIGDACNIWWMDVLENGPNSIHASHFDIDWHPVTPEHENKVLLPILEDQYGKVLEKGRLRLAYEDGAFFIHYYQTKLPVALRTYSNILGYQLTTLIGSLGKQNEHLLELESILVALMSLAHRVDVAPEKTADLTREKEAIRRRIAVLYTTSPEVRDAIDAAVHTFNGKVGLSESFDLLDALLDAQSYRLAFWRVAAEEINYRRFFDINSMAAIREELPEVLQATHQLIFQLLAEEKLTGLRVDHPDGLWDPASYFRQLQDGYLARKVQARLAEHSDDGLLPDVDAHVAAWLTDRVAHAEASNPPWPLYVIVEKILSENESLPRDWAVYGTTGYDFLNGVNGIFVDGRSRKALVRTYAQFIGAQIDFHDLTTSTKNTIMQISLASEINALSHRLERIAKTNRLYRDFTLNSLTFAIREVIACLPVYRTYIKGLSDAASPADQAHIKAAVVIAKKRNPRIAMSIFSFIQHTLLLQNVEDFYEDDRKKLVDFVMKLQQLTGSVMAKGVEDTAFYVYNRLVSLNEVGGNPERFGIPVGAFHRENSERVRKWPHSLLATSTHDAKRSEDVRARVNVLSEIPEEWRAAVGRWGRINAAKKTIVDGEPAPDRNDEYLLYQTLLGAWPPEPASPTEFADFQERILGYMSKALKEAKVHTSWINPNEEYEAAVHDFVVSLLSSGGENRFLDDLRALQRRVAFYGQFNSLSQVLLKLTSPGVPDTYQGSELWSFSLVDPDNRRPVDYQRRRSLLSDLKSQVERADADLAALAQSLLASSRDGRIKLYLTYRTLGFRRAHSQLFAAGAYVPLDARGYRRENVCAFARTRGKEAALVVAPRLFVRLTDGVERLPLGTEVWKDTLLVLPGPLASQCYRNLFTGEILSPTAHGRLPGLPLAAICGHFPVALLAPESMAHLLH